jgi:hypothetical protein
VELLILRSYYQRKLWDITNVSYQNPIDIDKKFAYISKNKKKHGQNAAQMYAALFSFSYPLAPKVEFPFGLLPG